MKKLVKLGIGIAIIWVLAILGASFGCATTKIDKTIEKNEVKIDSTSKTTIVEEVDTTITDPADTFDIFTPHLVFKDSTDTGGVIFDNHELNVVIKKKGKGTEIVIIKKEKKIPFKYKRTTTVETHLKKAVKNESKHVNKTTISLPWWLWLLIIFIIIILLYLLYRWLAKKFRWPYL